MYDFDIFVDSSANIPEELVQKHEISVISYSCTVNGVEMPCYEKNTDFKTSAKKFYAGMRSGADVKTSLVSSERIISSITPTFEAGKDAVLITITASISGTHNQALEAKKYLEAQFKGRTLYVCDSTNASMGQGLLALKAAALRELGEGAKACAEWVNENAYKLNSYFTVGDLKHIRKSGRISTVLALAGTILNIKPVLTADGGHPAKIVSFTKVRGRRKALTTIAEAFRDNAVNPESQTVAITHADCEQDALALAEMVKEYGAKDVIIEYYDLCTGAHVGPDTIALFFFGKDRRGDTACAERITKAKTAKLQA